ncbi:hypothetical protein BDR26DRAFT_780079, partial [Obelidium mucronatum]
MPFSRNGIDWKQLAATRTEKARKVIAMLAPLGFNSRGWAPAASARVYKAFVRPVMEYGLALYRGSPTFFQQYEAVQRLALRTL